MHDIRPTRVSLVKSPANKRKFLITKSEESKTMDDIIKIITDAEGNDESSLVEALKAQKKDDNSVQAALAVYRTLNAFRDSLDESDLDIITKSLGYESDPSGSDGAPSGDDVNKSDAGSVEVVNTLVDNGGETADAVNDALDTLRQEVEVLKSDKRRAEFTELLADVQVGKPTEELVDALMTIDKAGGDISQTVEILKTASNIAKQSLFDEFGSEGSGIQAANAYEAMKSAANEIASSEDIEYEEALSKLHKTRPELVTAYEEEIVASQ